MTGRIIRDAACIAEGTAWLAARDPHLARALARTGPPPLRLRPAGFAALRDAILAQQVSTAAAAAIGARLAAAGLAGEAALAAADPAALGALGLTRPKQRALQGLARAGLDYDALAALPDEALVARLTALPGIGRWTAEVYAILALGRADVFAAGDLALREAARLALGLDARPAEAELRRIAARWSPWRAVAARLLWAYYRQAKEREGMP